MTKIEKVGVIGSFRAKEDERTYYKEDEFPKYCEEIGKLLAENKYQLVVGWSNDYIYDQVSDNKYHFEDTAEYHALKGYLKNQSIKPIIYLSNLNLKIFNLAAEIYAQKKRTSQKKWDLLIKEFKDKNKPLTLTNSLTDVFSNEDINLISDLRKMQKGEYDGLTYLAYLLESDIEFISKILELDICKGMNADKKLRSMFTLDDVLPKIDLLFTIGGGKVTRLALDFSVMRQIPIFPIFSFGGETDAFFSHENLLSQINKIRDQSIQDRILNKIDKNKSLRYNKEDWESGRVDLKILIQMISEIPDPEFVTSFPPGTTNETMSIIQFSMLLQVIREEVKKSNEELKVIKKSTDNIEKNTNQICADIQELREKILSRFNKTEQELINPFISHLDENDMKITSSIIDDFENDKLDQDDSNYVKDIVNQVNEIIKSLAVDEKYPKEFTNVIRKLFELLNTLGDNTKHRCVLTVTIVPGILKYEVVTEGKIKTIWDKLTQIYLKNYKNFINNY